MAARLKDRFKIPLTFVVLFGAVACSGEPVGGEDAALSENSFGLMSVTYEHNWASMDQALILKTRAQFVHYTGMDGEHVAKLLALPLEPSRDLPEEDSCGVYDMTLDVENTGEEDGFVELLEAGNLRVETDGGVVKLRPRQFPGLLPFISGVVYAEADGKQSQLGNVKVQSEGGDAVGEFSSQAASPHLPRLERIGDAQSGDNAKLTKEPLALRWQASPNDKDETYIELLYVKGQRELALRCRPVDDGAFDVPASFMSELVGAADRLTLEVVRLRRTFFRASGLDRGELRVAVRERATLTR